MYLMEELMSRLHTGDFLTEEIKMASKWKQTYYPPGSPKYMLESVHAKEDSC